MVSGHVHSEEVLNKMFSQAAKKYNLSEEIFEYVRDVSVQIVQFDDEPEEALKESLADILADGGVSEEDGFGLIKEFVKRVGAPEGEYDGGGDGEGEDGEGATPKVLGGGDSSPGKKEKVGEDGESRFVDPSMPAALATGFGGGDGSTAAMPMASAAASSSSGANVPKLIRRPEDRFVCDVENMMLMYGGGRLLLRSADLVLKRAHRYGIVGVNGAGKTTLLTMIRQGKIPQLVDTKVVAVDEISAGGPGVGGKSVREYAKMRGLQSNSKLEDAQITAALSQVGFVEKKEKDEEPATPTGGNTPKAVAAEEWSKNVSDLSGGWRMRLALCIALLEETAPDLLLLDEPTNHLDVAAVAWLTNYLVGVDGKSAFGENTCVLMVSHDPVFLNGACSDIIHFHEQKLGYYEGNFEAFKKATNLNDSNAALLLEGKPGKDDFASVGNGGSGGKDNGMNGVFGKVGEGGEGSGEDGAEGTNGPTEAEQWKGCAPVGGPDKLSFPVPGKLEINWNDRKAVIDLKNTCFRYDRHAPSTPLILDTISCKLTMASRVAIVGANGAGKSTLMSLMSGETTAEDDATVTRHRNLRLAYIAQEHTFHLKEFWNCPPLIYMQKRYQYGYDGELQKRLKTFTAEEENQIAELAKKHGKYGKRVRDFCGRQIRGKEVYYEVQWEGLDDAKQNTFEPYSKLRSMGVERLVRAYDERAQSVAAGNDQRPLTNREIIRHFENFGFDEDFVCTRTIGSFSMGQKSRLTLGAALWVKPHLIMMDEPTNYIDADTLA